MTRGAVVFHGRTDLKEWKQKHPMTIVCFNLELKT